MDHRAARAAIERLAPFVGRPAVDEFLLRTVREASDTAPLELLFRRLAQRNDPSGWLLLCRALPHDEHGFMHAMDGIVGVFHDPAETQRAWDGLHPLLADPDPEVAEGAECLIDQVLEWGVTPTRWCPAAST